MWYYAQNLETLGPVSTEVLVDALQKGTLQAGTLVWKEGMTTWVPANRVPELGGVPTAGNVPQYRMPTVEELESYFRWYWILLAVGFPLCLVLVGIVPLFASGVFALLLVYNLWKLVPYSIDLPSPAEAVGFLFIPYFNFYWTFIAHRQLGIQLNRQLEARGKEPVVDETFLLTTLILSLIPVVSLVAAFMFIKVFYELKTAGVLLLTDEAEVEKEEIA